MNWWLISSYVHNIFHSIQVETCEKCQKNNKKLQKSAGGLHPIVIQPKIWCQVGMDLIGPMPETPRGNKYVVTFKGLTTSLSGQRLHRYQTKVLWEWRNSSIQ